MSHSENYDEKGNATHYEGGRVQIINLFERTFGTRAVMHFCEITALKYRLRMGKKKTQNLDQEILKSEWFEKAAIFYFEKLNSSEAVVGAGENAIGSISKAGLPWDEE